MPLTSGAAATAAHAERRQGTRPARAAAGAGSQACRSRPAQRSGVLTATPEGFGPPVLLCHHANQRQPAIAMSSTPTKMEPDAAMMRRHVGHLFEGWLDGCHDGRIELAWTDARDGKLKYAAIFGTDQLDELVERAVSENRKEGQNVYIGQALRKPDIAPFGRCKDDDFYALTAFYTDIDDDVVLAAAAKYKSLGCLPTAMVITGRHPHMRAQMLWRLNAPVRDADLCRRQNLAIAQALGGDTSVVNPSRVLRLGGSIAWPRKEGRIVELTELACSRTGRPREYLPEQIAKAFPPAEAARVIAESYHRAGPVSHIIAVDCTVGIRPARCRSARPICRSRPVFPASVPVTTGITTWFALPGHWISRGWSDAEIVTAAEALTLSGYTVAARPGARSRR